MQSYPTDTISRQEAINRFGTHFFVLKGHEESFDIVIKQNIGHLKSENSTPVYYPACDLFATFDEALKRHDEVLKQHCQNAINRFESHRNTLKGKFHKFRLDHGLFSKEKKAIFDTYEPMVEQARNYLKNGKEAIFEELPESFVVREQYPEVGEEFYVLDSEFEKGNYELKKAIVVENIASVSNKDHINVMPQWKNIVSGDKYLTYGDYSFDVDSNSYKNRNLEFFREKYYAVKAANGMLNALVDKVQYIKSLNDKLQ